MKHIFIKKFFFIAFITFLIYGSTLSGEFLFDDINLIQQNNTITSLKNIPQIFQEKFFSEQNKEEDVGYYRPLVLLSFMLDYRLWKLNPFGYHLTNIILHILNAILIFLLAYTLFKDHFISFFSSLLFAIHPIHTSAVSYISGRTDIMCGTLLLLSFLTFIYFLKEQKTTQIAASFLCFTLSLLCKENGLMLVVIIFFYYFYFLNIEEKKSFPQKKFFIYFFVFIIIAIIFLCIRKQIVELPPKNIILHNLPLRILTINKIFFTYLLLLLFPHDLHFERFTPVVTSLDTTLTISLLATIVMIVILFKYAKKQKSTILCLLWFFSFLLPVSQIIPIYVQGFLFTAEHFLYIPSITFFIFLSLGLKHLILNIKSHLQTKKKLIYYFTGAALVFYTFITISTNKQFKDPVTFYQYNLKFTPQSGRIRNNLGFTFYNLKKFNEAIKEYKINLKNNPNHISSWYNLGNAYLAINNLDSSIESFKKAILLNPREAKFYNNLSIALQRKKLYDDALNYQHKALELNPHDADYWYNLGLIYFDKKNITEALKNYQKAVELNPKEPEYLLGEGNIYFIKKNYSSAIEIYLKAIKINPSFIQSYFNLSICYLKTGQKDKAKQNLKKIIELAPNTSIARQAIEQLKKI